MSCLYLLLCIIYGRTSIRVDVQDVDQRRLVGVGVRRRCAQPQQIGVVAVVVASRVDRDESE